ncbi:hypothetical protein [Methanobacterium paludis]|uniref:Uncharacterized protein n=1 Tax=Methanobacterium paludis (strain DSM 25820 / JCM 18151 / SWAN1) TaxID=868131 RepID=F6D779_METPW|nr:hypothetical protein [Methanobacterium paludis]AEG18413.1 hypothetical protein MSWAN_1399 [Methanobacterium paludis]
MEKSDEIKKIKVEEEFRKCTVCGFNRGFHASFLKDDDSSKYRVIYICPECGSRYDVGLKVEL